MRAITNTESRIETKETEEAVVRDNIYTQTEALNDTTDTTKYEIDESITLEEQGTIAIIESELVTLEEPIIPTEAETITDDETEITAKEDNDTEVLHQKQDFKTNYRGDWMDALLKPSEARITQIKENNRVRLVQENFEYFDYSDGSIDTVVSKLLDEDKLISTGLVFTSATDEYKGDITDFIIKDYIHTVKDMIEPEIGTGKISHMHYYDATYTTTLRGKESYNILYTVESIVRIIKHICNIVISKQEMFKALVNCLVMLKSSMDDIKKIEQELLNNHLLEKGHTFVTDVVKAQAKAKKLQIDTSSVNLAEKQAFKIMKDYAFLNNQGKVQIINTTKLGLVASSESGLKALFKNQLINGTNPVDIWMQSEKRPLFTDTKFDPSRSTKDEAYNLFKGFAYPAQKTLNIVMFKNFVKEVICNGDEKMYNITWSFLAQMLQDPTRKMGTALVLLSAKGTGKSTFVKVIGKLLKGYFYQSADNKRLLGEFNNHLASTLLFYANELTFTDNKRVISKLKNVITEKNFTYEIKGGATYSADNFIRVIIDSNEDMAVVQTADERRFIYPVISEAKIENTEYFNELHDLFETKGFYESLMYDLMNFDYKPWEKYLKTPPKNEVTEAQVLESFTTIESWWLNCLEEGKLPNTEYSVSYDGRLSITSENLYQSFRKYTLKNGGRINGIDSGAFMKSFKKHILKELDLNISHRPSVDGKRTRFYIYERLSDQVKHFQKIKQVNHIDYDGEEWEASSSACK